MTAAYTHEYRSLVETISKDLGYGEFTRTGVYCMLSGPTYETPAEVRLVQAVSIIFLFVTLMLECGIFREKMGRRNGLFSQRS